MHRKAVQQLVGHHRPGPGLGGKAVQPLHPVHQVRQGPLQGLALAIPQVRADLQDAVACGQSPQALHLRQHLNRQGPAAGPSLQHVPAPGPGQQVDDLPGHGVAEEGRELGGGDEVPAPAEALPAGHVVAQAGLVEGGAHEGGEGQGPAALGHAPAQHGGHGLRSLALGGGGLGQGGVGVFHGVSGRVRAKAGGRYTSTQAARASTLQAGPAPSQHPTKPPPAPNKKSRSFPLGGEIHEGGPNSPFFPPGGEIHEGAPYRRSLPLGGEIHEGGPERSGQAYP